MNPRIQVEHTVTEEVTDVDLVSAQMRIAAGETLRRPGPDARTTSTLRGAALQCRITTEDPANGFRPDTGRITVYRSAGGAGVRLDGGTVFVGAEISAALRLDARQAHLPRAPTSRPPCAAPAARWRSSASAGSPPTSRSCRRCSTEPGLPGRAALTTSLHRRAARAARRRGSRRRPRHQAADLPRRRHGQPAVRPGQRPSSARAASCPAIDRDAPPRARRARPAAAGRAGRVRRARCASRTDVAVTDTTFRDAHQSLLATRVRTRDLLARRRPRRAAHPAAAQRGGVGRRDVRRGAALPRRGPLGAARRAARGHAQPAAADAAARAQHRRLHAVPDRGHRRVRDEAARTGIDIFRIFDALNDVDQMRPAIDAVRETGTAVAEVALCYTGNLLDPGEKLYTLDYYLRLAEQIVGAGAHVIAIKDMAGLLRAPAAARLVTALRERFDLPVHLHTHDTAGGQLATLLAAIDAGVDAVDAACASMSGTTSQPPMSALVAATDGTEHATGLDLQAVCDLEPYWEARAPALRARSSPAWPPPPAGSTPTRSPAGSCPTCASRPSPSAWATGSRRSRTCTPRRTASWATSSRSRRRSKVVGDLALALVGAGADPAELRGGPARSSTSPTRSSASSTASSATRPAAGPSRSAPRPSQGRTRKPARQRAVASRTRPTSSATPRRTLNRLLFPGPTKEFEDLRETYRRPVRPRHRRVPPRPGSGRGARGRARARQAAAARRAVDQRRRRARHAHRHVHRSTASSARSRCATGRSPVDVQAGREGRPRRRRAGARRRSPGWSRCRWPRATPSRSAAPVATIEAMKMEAAITTPVGRHRAAPGHRRQPAGRGRRPAARRRLTTPVTRSWSRRPRHRRRRNRHRRSRCRPRIRGWR